MPSKEVGGVLMLRWDSCHYIYSIRGHSRYILTDPMLLSRSPYLFVASCPELSYQPIVDVY